jgi:DNA-binding NarL/FixJ family response regulator
MNLPFERTGLKRAIIVLLVEDSDTDRELFVAHVPADGSLGFEFRFARTLQAARTTLSTEKVDLIVLDLNLPDSDGLDTCRTIKAAAPEIPIVVLTGTNDEEVGIAAVAAGAQDYLVKGTNDDNLLPRAIRFALQRAERERAAKSGQGPAVAARLESLTPREREVLELLVAGTSAKCVASRFGISVQTVAKHRAKILDKMEANNDVELVRLMLGGSSDGG